MSKVKIKNEEDIKKLRVSCSRIANVLRETAKEVKPGVSTGYLNDFAHKLIVAHDNDVPAFLNYQPYGSDFPYPASVCISVNEEIVHGIPSYDRILQEGDIVSLDSGIKHEGLISDHAITVPCGQISEENQKLLDVTKNALKEGIKAANCGNYVRDISQAIENYINSQGQYGIVKILSGHGVGYAVHEPPYVPNYDDGTRGPKLVPGMVLAIEPMVNIGTDDAEICADGYTFVTADGKWSAHFEHTILITNDKAEILTL